MTQRNGIESGNNMITTIKPSETIAELLADDDLIEQTLNEAAREAMLRHKREGQAIVIWEDGRIIHVPPDQIVVPPIG